MHIQQAPWQIADLIEQAVQGQVVPAAFQRAYAWEDQDVEALCESLLAGYPIGGIVMWETMVHHHAGVARTRLGPIVRDHGPATKAWMVVDGLHRLSTLMWLASTPGDRATMADHPSVTNRERWVWLRDRVMTLDMSDVTMRFMSPEESMKPWRLPAYVLFDNKSANEVIQERLATDWSHLVAADGTFSEDLMRCLDRFDTLQRRIKKTPVMVAQLHQAAPDEVRDVLMHVRRPGMPMAAMDFDHLIQWQRDPGLVEAAMTAPSLPEAHARRMGYTRPASNHEPLPEAHARRMGYSGKR